mgnify:CR=1 FL=1
MRAGEAEMVAQEMYEQQQEYIAKEEAFIRKHMGSRWTAQAKGRLKKLNTMERRGKIITKPRGQRKEMYDFLDKGERHLALRPEGTASVVRAFIQHRPPTPWKTWYVAPSFRYERPQAARYRQHHQVGAEAIGADLVAQRARHAVGGELHLIAGDPQRLAP